MDGFFHVRSRRCHVAVSSNTFTHSRYLLAMFSLACLACGWILPSRQAINGSQNEVRPTANPINPGTRAAVRSHSITLCSSDPRPRMMHPTRSRPSRRATLRIPEAILPSIQPLDLPDIRLNPRILKLFQSRDHQRWPQAAIVEVLITLHDVHLRVGGGHQQFEHEIEAVAVAVVAQLLETRELAIHRLVILGIVAHQDFDEGWLKLLDMGAIERAELELKLCLAALFRRQCGDEAIDGRIAQDM